MLTDKTKRLLGMKAKASGKLSPKAIPEYRAAAKKAMDGLRQTISGIQDMYALLQKDGYDVEGSEAKKIFDALKEGHTKLVSGQNNPWDAVGYASIMVNMPRNAKERGEAFSTH